MNRTPQQMELFPASQIAERLGNNDRLMEMILERNNIIRELNQYFWGWWNYFRLTEAKSFLKGLKIRIMRRLRSLV